MIRELVYYGSPILRKKCRAVKEMTDEVRQVCQDLIDTVIEKKGAGLAAPQIGSDLRIFVSCYENEEDDEGWPILCYPKVFVNPKISNPSEEMISHKEGCLSIPGIQEQVLRPYEIDIEAMDMNGNLFTERATGWHARCVMHENDHINGVLFIDRIATGRRKKIEPDLKSLKKKFR